jgi:superfamily II DNA or RNA helicase
VQADSAQKLVQPKAKKCDDVESNYSEALTAVPETETRVIPATGSYIGEGFDDARLDTLFLAMPISLKGTLQQYVGRLHRLHDGKRVVQVYEYIDPNVIMLARSTTGG